MTLTAEDVERVARALRLTPGHHGTQVEAAAMLRTLQQERDEAKAEAYENAATECDKYAKLAYRYGAEESAQAEQAALMHMADQIRHLAAQARQEGTSSE